MYLMCRMCVGSVLCAMLLKQNVAGMQNFSATVGWLGPCWTNRVTNRSKLGHMWVTSGSRGSPGHVDGFVGPMGHVGHCMGKWIYVKWLLGLLDFVRL